MKQLIIFYYKHFRFAAVLCLLTLVISNVKGADLTIDLNTGSSNVFSLSTSSANDASTEITKSSGGYSYKLKAADACYYYSSKALFIGKSGSYIKFPAVSGKKLTKVTIYNCAGASSKGTVSICPAGSSTPVSGGAASTISAGSYTTWTLSGTSANTSYQMYINNGYNVQVTRWILEYTNAGTNYTLVFKDPSGTKNGDDGSVSANATSFTLGSTKPSKTGHHLIGFYKESSLTNLIADTARTGATVTGGKFRASTAYTNSSKQYTETAGHDLYLKWEADSYAVTSTLTNCSADESIPSSVSYTGSGLGWSYTITPSDGYALPSSITLTMGGVAMTSGTDYTWNSSTGALTVSKVITGPIVLTITAVRLYTITFNDNGSTTNYVWQNGSVHATPSIVACDAQYGVLGWTTTAPTSNAWATQPSYTAAGGNITVSGDATYYAVYTTEGTTPTNKFKRVTSSSDLISGEKYVITNTAETYALDCNTFYTDKSFPTVSVSPSSGIITTDADKLIYAITGNNTSGYSIYSEEDGGTGIGYDNSEGVLAWYSGGPAHWLITVGESNAVYIQAKKATTKYLQYSSSYYWLLTTETANHLFRQMYNTLYISNPTCCTKHDITLASSGSVTGGTFTTSAASACEGTEVTLTATPSDGYAFAGWTVTNTSGGADVTNAVLGAGHAGDNPATMTMPEQAVTVNATFATLTGITVKTAPTKTTYCEGDYFDPTGLVITASFSNSTSLDIPYAGNEAKFTFSPTTSTALTTGNSSVSISYGGQSTSQAITVNAHLTISLTGSGTVTGGTFTADESSSCVGATITIEASAADHYSFNSWTIEKAGGGTVTPVSATSASTTFIMPDANVTVTASFNEDAYKTVCFKNNGVGIAGYTTQKVYVGERPVAPTLTDGTSGDACDATSDTHYGWTKETWTSPIATQSEIDARTGTEAVYAKSAALPIVAAGDPSTITYHAVWTQQSGTPSNEYQLVTNISQLSAGDKIVIANAGSSSTYLMSKDTVTESGYQFRRVAQCGTFSISSSKITISTSASSSTDRTNPHVFTVGKSGDYWTFYDPLLSAYMACTSVGGSGSGSGQKNGLGYENVLSDAGKWSVSISSEAVILSQISNETTDRNRLQANGSPFGTTSNFTCTRNTQSDPYIFRNLSTLSNSNFMTTCCDKNITIGIPSITGSGTVTFTLGGNAIAPGDEVETCSGAKDIVATVTPAAGYSCTALSFSGGSVSVDPTPEAGNYPSAPSAQNYTLSFEANTTATLATTATFTAKTASAWEWKYNGEEIPDPLVLYVGINKQLDVTYTPDDLLNTQKNYTVTKTDAHVAQGGKAYNHYTMRGAAGVTEVTNTTVTFTLSGLSKEVNVTVKPQPRVHFVDIVHGESFADVGPAVESYVATFIQPTPTHSDVSDPGVNYNSCERGHLHLLGWIESTWADAHPGATSAAITDAGSGIYYEAGASINVEDQNGKTFYAVWCVIE